MDGLDNVESLMAEASANLSTNRNHLISTTVNGTNFAAGLVDNSCQNISITVGMTKKVAKCTKLFKIFLVLWE